MHHDRMHLAALLLATVLLAACGGGGAVPAEPTQAAEPPRAAGSPPGAAGSFPVTVENCGRELTFERPPSRVITGYHPVFETMVELGLGDRIVARTNFSENGPDGFLPGHKEVYDQVPEISDTIELPQKEVMLAQEADFVIAISYNDFNPAAGQATIAELDAAGAQVYITGGWCDAEGVRNAKVSDLFADIANLGRIFGVPDAAAELAAEYEALIADVEERVAGREPVAVLATDGGAGPVNAYGGSGFMHQMIEMAGGRNVLADLDEDYTEVSVEQIAATQPEAMLVLDYDILFGEAQPSAQQKADTVFALIPDSPAAQARRFLPIPAKDAHSGTGNILAIPKIARFLHPEAFEGT